MLWLSEQQKFGAAFTAAGSVFFLLGILSFFNQRLLSLGNIVFLLGITLLIGPSKTLGFFLQRSKIKGFLCFVIGITMIVFFKKPFIGFSVELFGILLLFGDFLRMIITFLRSLPIIGPVLSYPAIAPFIDRIANIDVLPV